MTGVQTCALPICCASGPSFAEYSAKQKPPAPGQGRIWFYRPSKIVGVAVQPAVMLNNTKIGKAQPGCFFMVDRAAGSYEAKRRVIFGVLPSQILQAGPAYQGLSRGSAVAFIAGPAGSPPRARPCSAHACGMVTICARLFLPTRAVRWFILIPRWPQRCVEESTFNGTRWASRPTFRTT